MPWCQPLTWLKVANYRQLRYVDQSLASEKFMDQSLSFTIRNLKYLYILLVLDWRILQHQLVTTKYSLYIVYKLLFWQVSVHTKKCFMWFSSGFCRNYSGVVREYIKAILNTIQSTYRPKLKYSTYFIESAIHSPVTTQIFSFLYFSGIHARFSSTLADFRLVPWYLDQLWTKGWA